MATIVENSNFDVTESCKEFHMAIWGLGTNKIKINKIIASLSNKQRQKLKEKYKFMYNKEIIDELKGERTVSGDYRDTLLALLAEPSEFDAKILHDSLNLLVSQKTAILEVLKNRSNAKPYVLIEILVTRSYEELLKIQDIYKKMYARSLDTDIKKSMSLDQSFVKILRTILGQPRSVETISITKAASEAKLLIDAEKNVYSFETELIRIFTSWSYPELVKIIAEYKNQKSKDLEISISECPELEASFKEILLAIIECAQDKTKYFAKKLNEYIEYSYGPKDHSIIRVVVSRSEIDLELIKKKFRDLFNRNLSDSISSKTSGNFQLILNSIIDNESVDENSNEPLQRPNFLKSFPNIPCSSSACSTPNGSMSSYSFTNTENIPNLNFLKSPGYLTSTVNTPNESNSKMITDKTDSMSIPSYDEVKIKASKELNNSIQVMTGTYSESPKPEIMQFLSPNSPTLRTSDRKISSLNEKNNSSDELLKMINELVEKVNKLETITRTQQETIGILKNENQELCEMINEQRERLNLVELAQDNTTNSSDEKQVRQESVDDPNFYNVKVKIAKNDLKLRTITINSKPFSTNEKEETSSFNISDKH